MSSIPSSFFLPMVIFLFASLDTSSLAEVPAISYAQHCDSIAPKSSPTKLVLGASNSFHIANGFFSGGGRLNDHLFDSPTSDTFIHDSRSASIFHFQPGQVHLTHHHGTLQLEGTLVLEGARVQKNRTRSSSTVVWSHDFDRRRAIFKLSGFWSEEKGKLCMVGTGEIRPSREDWVASTLSVVLKLEYPKASKITTSAINGAVESLDSDTSLAHFERVSLLAYAQRSYEYTLTTQAKEVCSHLPQVESVASDSTSLCSNLQNIMRHESFTSSDLIGFLGFRFLSPGQLVCSDDGRVRLSMTLSNRTLRFSDVRSLVPGKSLVAEGVWDYHNGKLCLLACHLIGKETNSSVVGDCSLRLAFWFPASFSLKLRSTMVGRIWNIGDERNNDGKKILSLYSTDRYSNFEIPGMKYKYTELDRAKKYCRHKNFNRKAKERYPDAESYMDMRFHLRPHLVNGLTGWGDAQQISTGEIYHGTQYGGSVNEDSMYTNGGTTIPSSTRSANQTHTVSNVGYTISYSIWDKNFSDSVRISAEGIYNSTTGIVCLVGCRQPSFTNTRNGEILNGSARIDDRNLDCEFFIQLQVPPLDAKNRNGRGTIESTRAKSDPLYFKPIEVKFSLMYRFQSMQILDRMDGEMIMVIISLTFLCACTYLQLRHGRKHTKIRPLMSTTMLVVLTAGCMVSLVLKTEAMLVPASKEQVFLQSGGWSETTNTIARLITMVALLINVRLLQLTWRSRSSEESTQGTFWHAEKKCLMFCVPSYIVGALAAWFVHSHFSKLHQTILEDLARYVGLIVDGFLLPQIVFNIFSNSREKVLNPFFYVGATAVRSVPHIYSAYRAWWYPDPVDVDTSSYLYANPGEDYYSALFDVIIPFEGLLFVLLIYLQQRSGGRCFLPKRFKHGAGYELVSVSNI